MKSCSAFLVVGSTLLAFIAMSPPLWASASPQNGLTYEEAEYFEVHKEMLNCIACSKNEEAKAEYLSCLMLLPDGCQERFKQCTERYVQDVEEIDVLFSKVCGQETLIRNVIECSTPPNDHCKPSEDYPEEEEKIVEEYKMCVRNVMQNHCKS